MNAFINRVFNRYSVAALLVLVMIFGVVTRTSALRALGNERGAGIAIVYTPGQSTASDSTRLAYAESLREAGIPFNWIASTDFALFSGEQLSDLYSAIVFPDGIDRRISEDAVAELTAFASLGGTVAVIGDAGSETADGVYRAGSLFQEVTGVDSVMYRQLRSRAFAEGKVRFSDLQAVARWSVPSGKTDDDDLSGYIYGPLDYPYARSQVIRDGVRVDASTGSSPIVSVRRIGRGRIAYLGLPLGYLRTHSDGFPMQMLIAYLTRFDDQPHLVAAPDGVGQMIIDIHIDSSNEYVGIPNLRHSGLLRHDVPMEFDVTAGPDLQKDGDGLGFAACEARGEPYLRAIMPYGRIGSHGGWAHNEFARKILTGEYGPTQIRELIDRNDRCLESVTHVPVRSFAAPVGVHPQPMMTQILDQLGIIGYYYTGDTGAPAERPFYNGKLVSTKSWAFPVMPLGDVASIEEMRVEKIAPKRVEQWLDQTSEYAADRHGIYLFYSHSYDFEYKQYAKAMGQYLDHVEAMERSGRLRLTNMVTAAEFMDRFMATTSSFTRADDGVHVRLANPQGLRSIAFAIPSAWINPRSLPDGVRRTGEQRGYTIFSVDTNQSNVDLTFPKAEAS
jgi:hypothetical protein